MMDLFQHGVLSYNSDQGSLSIYEMLRNLHFSLFLAIETVYYERRVLYLPLKMCNFHFLKDLIVSFRAAALPSSTYLFTAGVEGFDFSLDHTQAHITFCGTPLDEGSARRRELYLATQTLYKTNIHDPVGFEPTIPASARPQTYALDRASTGKI
jgi:hypothetical protein